VESTVAEVLIVKKLEEGSFYEVVTWVGLGVLLGF
jgi:hypothetical protein